MLRLLLAPLAISALTAPLELSYAPASGSQWRTTLDLEQTISGGSLEVIMAGNETPSAFLPKLSTSGVDSFQLVTSESVENQGEGNALTFTRHYETASRTRKGEFLEGENVSHSWDDKQDSALLLRTVRFARDADDETYLRTLGDDDESPIETMDGLAALLSPAHLLPDTAIEPGDSWTIEGEALAALFDPAGDLGFKELEGLQGVERTSGGKLYATLSTTASAGDVCEIELEGQISQSWSKRTDLTEVPVSDGKADEISTTTYEVSGTLLWDLATANYRSLELQGDGEHAVRVVRDPDLPGATYEHTFRCDATYSLKVERNAVEAKAAEAGAKKEREGAK